MYLKKEMFEPFLLQYGFYRAESNEKINPEGDCYELLPEKGTGYYWVYTYDNLFSIEVQDFTLYKDLYIQYPQPEFLSVSCYDSVSGEELNPYKHMSCNCIKGHIGYNNVYRAVLHKNIPIRCTTIMVMPAYYKSYLQKRYPGEYEDPISAFLSIDGSTDFPELKFLLNQVKNYPHTGISAKLFYESKVAEAISLIVSKTKKITPKYSKQYIEAQDMERITSVREYINDHFAFDMGLPLLANIACMSVTKLKYTFKKALGCTVSEYIHSKRMNHAEHLLINTDISIKQISQIVGYSKANNFSSAFRKFTGLLPSEFRKLTLLQTHSHHDTNK